MRRYSLPAVCGLTLLGWASILGGCKTTSLPVEHQLTLAELEAQAQAQEAAGDEAGLAQTEAQMTQVIAEGAEQTVHGIFGPLSPLIPGGPLIEAGIASLAWLAFPRPRKHAVRVLKGINPANRELTPLDSLKSIGAAFGLMHSSAGSKQAFDGEQPV